MREIAIVYDDGRPDCRVALDAMVSGDPFSWDGSNRERGLVAAEGYPAPQTARLATRQLLRTDAMHEEGLRLDITWFDAAVADHTRRAGSHVPGVSVHMASEQAGRSLLLVSPSEMGHVVQVEVDGEAVLQRRLGYLCDLGRLRCAAARYGHADTGVLRVLLGSGGGGFNGHISSIAVCDLHELIRRDHPEWYDRELSDCLGRPVWDEAAIAAEHGYPEGAWWRTAARATADGVFYSPRGRPVEDAFVWRPVAAWYRATSFEEAGPVDAAEWLGLPAVDANGTSPVALLKNSWRDGVPIRDEEGSLAAVLGAFGVMRAL